MGVTERRMESREREREKTEWKVKKGNGGYLLRAARMDRTPQTGSRVSPTKKVTSTI